MNILFVSGNLCDGGAQRVISVVSSALAEKGHEVSLLLFSRNSKEYPLSDKVRITAVRDSYEEYCKVSSFQRMKFIRKYLRELKPDVAVGFLEGGYALYLSSFGLKMKKVASARIDPQILMNRRGLRAYINRLWFKAADAFVLQTQSQTSRIPEKLKKKSTVIVNPISDNALSIEKNNYNNCRNFVMAGRLDEQKNYPMVFRAISQVVEKYPDVHVDVFGKGNEHDKLLTLINEMGLDKNISLRGWTQNTVEEYLRRDAYILSSNSEGLPNALMEAMAVGLPCISTDCNTGPSDLINDGENGFLIPVDDDKMLALRIIDIVEMSVEQRAKMGSNARKTIIENYSSDVVAQQWENLFSELTK